jgi:ATP-dependent DNA helicase RecQ
MACTATANDRVVEDVVRQLGGDLAVFRGPLARRGLALQVVDLEAPAARLAWLAATVPRLSGSGIIYCLTVGDAEMVAAWLREQGIRAMSYSAASDDRVGIEQDLLTNEVDVVVATSALGMGFDKPDLAFVIHFQSPGSVITYYQQVGRAGRQLPASFGVLLRGREDVDIEDWFINSAFPTAGETVEVLASLEQHDGYMKLAELEQRVNVRRSRLELLLKNLEVDGAIVTEGQSYLRTARSYAYDDEHVVAVTQLRRAEQQQMRDYGTLISGCRMAFLAAALDDPHAQPCGICDLCASPPLPTEYDASLSARAASFLRRRPVVIEARRVWPDRRTISVDRRSIQGRALCRWGDGGWSELVKRGKQVDGRFDQQLVVELADLVRGWRPHPDPAWITWVPSLDHPVLVAQLAAGVGEALGLPTVEAVVKVRATEPQKTMQNSAQQLANITGASAVHRPLPAGPVLLIDDVVDSRWTLTYVGSLLREAGVDAVVPVALTHSGPS